MTIPMSSSSEQLLSLVHCWHHDLNRQFQKGRSNIKDLTILQLQALIFIKKNPPVMMSDIAKEFSITKASATALIERLVKSGWLKRTLDARDRRLVYITLTTSGQKKIMAAKQTRMAILDKSVEVLSEHDKNELLRILKLITISK
jgi:DNA-binding MarR family transcriptional regulator